MNVEICSQHTMPVYKMSMSVFLPNQCPMWASLRLSIMTAPPTVSSNTKTKMGSG